ncbi:MAG: hypothetical protein LBG27_11560 [Spirochaetaceae bacterium]|jgi:hypothetical protein|nr:hypothetical protein [Spirochaetaceae bacterium]
MNEDGTAGGITAGGVVSEGAFLIPQTVFVGDEGRLVVPYLENAPLGTNTHVVVTSGLPFNDDIIVKRVEIDVASRQLLIDFAAFRPGVVAIPPIPAAGLPPLTVSIASILERDGYSTTLSPPEKPLAAPGTFALIIGGTAALIALAALVGLSVSYGPRHFQRLFEKMRLRFLRYKAKRAIFAAENALASGRVGTKEGAAAVSEAFRWFLGAIYRKDYASYSAEDFLADGMFSDGAVYHIFADCDRLKFSPARIGQEAVNAVAGETLSYIERVVYERVVKGSVDESPVAGSAKGFAA